jgi:isopenicillin-N epimerase
VREQFLLDPEVAFLNHGSFGATPCPVFETYQYWQRELERQPVEFLGRRRMSLQESARAALGDYLHCSSDDLAFVTNATVGVNTVVRCLPLQPGDEILLSDQEYGSVRLTWEHYAAKVGAVVVQQPVTLPLTTSDAIIEDLWRGVTPRTRVIAISHITSPTALTFPVAEICARARAEGIWTVIDGAHAPGQIDVDLQAIDADAYTGNCHKWMCAPKGAAFLYVRPDLQAMIDPLVMSWGSQRENPFAERHEWQGTRDIAAYLSIPAAIEFQQSHDWPALREACHRLLCETRRRVQTLTGLEQIAPESSQFFAQMAALTLPGVPEDYSALYPDYRVEVPIHALHGHTLVRVSVQVYNTQQDLDRLITALEAIIKTQSS